MLAALRDGTIRDAAVRHVARPVGDTVSALSDRLARVHPLVLVAGTAATTYLGLTAIRLYRRSEQPICKRFVVDKTRKNLAKMVQNVKKNLSRREKP
jgi:hypothetical protein